MSKFLSQMKHRGIVFKIFVITTLLLLFASLMIYFSIYFFLPGYYKDYKLNRLETAMSDLIKETEGKTLPEFFEASQQYQDENNAMVYLIDTKSDYGLVTAPKDYLRQELLETNELEKSISLKERDYIIKISQTLQPVDEAQSAILRFFPYVIIVIFLISILGAMFYARILSKPLLELNSVGKKMAKLDFSTKSEYKAEDEIGELAETLNNMSSRLQRTIDDLHIANELLTKDIEHVKSIEAERKDLFVAISHELKTPITIVKGQLEGMLHRIGIYKDRDSYLKRSLNVMEDLEGLVKEILNLSRIENVGFNPSLSDVNISRTLQDIVYSFSYFSSDKKLNVSLEIDPDIFVQTDKNLLEKGLRNVIHNAMMYSPNEAEIQISCQKEDTNINVSVFNSGVFIEEDHLKTIFEPFNRLEKSRNRNSGGTGIGLYLVKRVFNIIHVQYEIKNVKNGVLFTINIPV
ncbi:sensor histidine kinase [Cytobacillus sp. Hm23]